MYSSLTLYAGALVLLNLLATQIAAQYGASIPASYQGRGRAFGFEIDGGSRAHVAIGPNLFGVPFDNMGAMGNPIWSTGRSDDAIAGIVYDSANNSLIVCTRIYREVYRLTMAAGQVASSELIRSKSWTNSRYWNGCSLDPTTGALFIAASQEIGCWPNIHLPATNTELSEPYYTNDLNSQLYSPIVAVHAGKVYFGDSLIFATSTSNFQLSSSQINQYSVSSGQIQSMAISKSSNCLYVGTDQGTLVEISLSTMSLSRTNFVDDAVIYSIIIEDEARTLFVNSVSKMPPTTSRIIRYNLNENFLRGFGLLSFPAGVSVNYGTLDTRAGKYQMLFSNFAGDTVTSIRTVSCIEYSCSTCQEDTNYCGYCTSSRTCVTSNNCASSNFFRQDYVCPAVFGVSPSSGSTDGGTQVTVTGQFTDFSGTPITSGFECQWGSGRVPAEMINAATLRCTSPSGSAGDTSFRVVYGGSLWTPTSLTYSYYSCSALTGSNPCDNCFALEECGLCVPPMQCSSARGCSNGFTKSCPVIKSLSPESASIAGNNNFTITLDQNIPINANYQCMYSSTTSPALISIATPATFVSPNTLSCKPPTVTNWMSARGVNRDLLVDLVIKVSTSSAVLASSKSKAIYLFDCDTFLQDCSSCTSSLANNECSFCFDLQECHYNSSVSCTTTGTCPAITSVSPSRIYSGNLQMALTISMTGQFLSLKEETILCAWDSVGDNMGSQAYTVSYQPSLISCVIPTTLIVGLHSISIWIYSAATSSYSRVVPNFPVEVYSCLGTSCATCLSPNKPECVFCSSSANCTHSSNTCSEKITLSSSCPSISSASPASSGRSGNTTVVIKGLFNPTVLDNGVSCRWFSSFTTTTPPVYVGVNEVRCIAPAVPGATLGTVFLAVNNNAWSNSLPFLWYDCAQTVGDCSQCISALTPGCKWCTSGCDEVCSDQQLTVTQCPSLTSIQPSQGFALGGESVVITGGPFFSGPSFVYACRFGDRQVEATVDSVNTLICKTPVVLIAQQVNVTVWMNGLNYAPYSSLPFTFFECQSSSTGQEVCSSECSSQPGCGWCVLLSRCTPNSRCSALGDIHLTQCLNVTVAPSRMAYNQVNNLTFTFSPAIPALAQNSKRSIMQTFSSLRCQSSNGINTDAQIKNDNQITCQLPPPNVQSPSVISVAYQRKELFSPLTLTHLDCATQSGDCSSCTDVGSCGWCSESNSCTTQPTCSGSFSTTCPNVVEPPGTNPNNPLSGDNPNSNNVSTIVPAVVIPVVAVAVGLTILLVLLKRKKKNQQRKTKKPREVDEDEEKEMSPLKDSPASARKSTQSISVMKALDTINEKLRIPFSSLVMKKEIGAGSYGKVFLGEWKGAKVAIKVCASVANVDGFFDEAALTVGLPPHPNVVQTFGISVDGALPCIVLEFCGGGSLDTKLFDNEAHITLDEKVKLIKGMARGLLHLHQNNVVHRDLAARNILITKSGEPKISDFGMSRLLKEASQKGQTKNNIGPIRWMAPESLRDLTYSTKSDVWSFGILMYEVLTSSEPHTDIDGFEVAIKIKNENYHPAVPSTVDPALGKIMLSCWNADPAARPSMEQVLAKIFTHFSDEDSD